MSFYLTPFWIILGQDPLLRVWLYDFSCTTISSILINLIAVLVVAIVSLNYYYFNVDPRKEAHPENYTYEFALNLLKYKDHGTLEYFQQGFEKAHARGRDTFIVYMPFLPTYIFVNDPAIIEHVLKTNFDNYIKGPQFYSRMNDLLGNGIFTSDGDAWLRHRKISAKLFNLNVFKGSVMQQFNIHVDKVSEILYHTEGKAFDFQDLMYRFTLDSIGQIAFGHDFGCLTNEDVNFARVFDFVQQCNAKSFIDPMWQFNRMITYEGFKYAQCIRTINELAYSIITDRRATEDIKAQSCDGGVSTRGDLLSLYLTRQDEDGALSDKELRDIVMNFMLAGRDTTANALSWAMYRLCIHPHIQEVVRAEVVAMVRSAKTSTKHADHPEALLDGNGCLTYHALQSLKYLDAFLMEVIRLHPPLPKDVKFAKGADILPDGTVVKAGDGICFCPWIMGRTESLWEHAQEFIPERFYNQPKPSPFVYTAFFAGPRYCLGSNLAILEMKCLLARLLLQFEFTIQEDPTKVTYYNSLTLPMDGGLKVAAKPVRFL